MSRLELLLKRWRLELEFLRRRVRDNRVGDAWRFQPLIKVFVFLLKCYGSDDSNQQNRPTRLGKLIRGMIALVVVLAVVAANLHWASGGGVWSRLRERIGDWAQTSDA